jgi:DDE superfamily endonuclease/Winged helix-turn helix
VGAGLRASDAFVLRRCQILLASARGERASAIARHLGCDDQTVREALHAFNAVGAGRSAAQLAASPHPPGCLRCRPSRAAARAAAPEPAHLRPAQQPVDAGAGGPGQLRAGADRRARPWRDHPRYAPALGRGLEARQALAGQSRSGVRPEKSARDRLIQLASTHPAWALGFQDETWWSRLARPALHARAEPGRPLRLVEQTVAKADPDPKALACYGLLVRWAESAGNWHEEAWLRFVDGRPVSALTTRCLAWCCTELQALGKRALLLIRDNAAWHVSREVRTWIRGHKREVKLAGCGVRIVACYLPIKSPWLNAIEPKWVHGKRRIVEPARLPPAGELVERVCAAFDCPHHAHLTLAEDAA